MMFFILLLPLLSFAHVAQDDVATTEKNSFSFKTVCQAMVTHETPLIEVVSGTEIDCMGKKITVGDFCLKEMAHDPYYLRAYVNADTKEVVCHSGKKVIFKYQCVKLTDKKFCEGEAKSSCEVIKKKLAYRLDLVHFSNSKNEKGIKELKCDFESLPLKRL